MQQSMRKEKLRKVGPCFMAGCFIKPFNMIIMIILIRSLFYFASLFPAKLLLFNIRMMQEKSKVTMGTANS